MPDRRDGLLVRVLHALVGGGAVGRDAGGDVAGELLERRELPAQAGALLARVEERGAAPLALRGHPAELPGQICEVAGSADDLLLGLDERRDRLAVLVAVRPAARPRYRRRADVVQDRSVCTHGVSSGLADTPLDTPGTRFEGVAVGVRSRVVLADDERGVVVVVVRVSGGRGGRGARHLLARQRGLRAGDRRARDEAVLVGTQAVGDRHQAAAQSERLGVAQRVGEERAHLAPLQAARRGVQEDPPRQGVLAGRDRQLRREDAVRDPVAVLVDRGQARRRRQALGSRALVCRGDDRVALGARIELERAQLVLEGLVEAEAHEPDDAVAQRAAEQLLLARGAQRVEAAIERPPGAVGRLALGTVDPTQVAARERLGILDRLLAPCPAAVLDADLAQDALAHPDDGLADEDPAPGAQRPPLALDVRLDLLVDPRDLRLADDVAADRVVRRVVAVVGAQVGERRAARHAEDLGGEVRERVGILVGTGRLEREVVEADLVPVLDRRAALVDGRDVRDRQAVAADVGLVARRQHDRIRRDLDRRADLEAVGVADGELRARDRAGGVDDVDLAAAQRGEALGRSDGLVARRDRVLVLAKRVDGVARERALLLAGDRELPRRALGQAGRPASDRGLLGPRRRVGRRRRASDRAAASADVDAAAAAHEADADGESQAPHPCTASGVLSSGGKRYSVGVSTTSRSDRRRLRSSVPSSSVP